MGKTTYSRNPSTSKGTIHFIQSPEVQAEILEFIIRIPMKLPRLLKDLPLQKLNSISRMSLLTEDVSPIPNIMEELVELDRLQNSERPLEDGPKNQSKLYLD